MPKYWDDRNIWGEKFLSEGLGRSLSFKDRKIDIAAHDRSGKKVYWRLSVEVGRIIWALASPPLEPLWLVGIEAWKPTGREPGGCINS